MGYLNNENLQKIYTVYKNTEQLKKAIQKEWDALSLNVIKKLFLEFTERLLSVLQNNGRFLNC